MQEILSSEIEDAAKLLEEFRQAVKASPHYTRDIHRAAAKLSHRVGVLLGYVSRWDLMDNQRPTMDEV